MAKLVSKKVQASTLIEVLIAMVVIMVVFSIAIKVFSNVMSSGVSFSKIRVQNQLGTLAAKVKSQGYVEEERLMIDSVNYELLVKTGEFPNLSVLEIKASKYDKPIGSLKCMFINKERNAEN